MKNVEFEKNNIRLLIRALKRELTDFEKQKQSAFIFSKIESLDVFLSSKRIAIYWSLPDEVQTHKFIEKWCFFKTIFLPVIEGSKLIFKQFDGVRSMQINKLFGILEPQGSVLENLNLIDFIVVPGVAFDDLGNRLGRGKGYYDRVLKQMNNSCKVGVGFNIQKVEKIPVDEYDIPMDMIIWGQ
ncbi:MAG: 5-formyltetrahydrofolate cyclo-ligase [Marinilabiliaceae bacterium]|nr:5-formyltetrahydrofolate cyclo-ligase [Marinilabiliaceae bacterium]